ncbi:MAG: ATP synthase F1 subunit delta [Bacteroidetes bacterium HGW-Bacteroidetes-6]|jgi:F-type H+-transporting ATPase subunit delta|nr:MAG: ATP synthase F1 subunit delta [Bacteroidetes bacterium HGW-Bacteroidetes-6]
MNNTQISKRYALALFELADEMKILPVVESNMRMLLQAVREVAEMRNILRSPIIKVHVKKKVVAAVFEKHVHELTMRFLNLMIIKGRETYLAGIATEFVTLCMIHQGKIEVDLTSAYNLNPSIVAEIEQIIAIHTKLTPVTTLQIDPRLLGGFVVRYGDKSFDSSLRNKITKVARDFEKNIYEKGL